MRPLLPLIPALVIGCSSSEIEMKDLTGNWAAAAEKATNRASLVDNLALSAQITSIMQAAEETQRGKAVVVLPDLHIQEDASAEENRQAQKVQDFQAAVLSSLVDRYGFYDLVLENVPFDVPQETLVSQLTMQTPLIGQFSPSEQIFLLDNPFSVQVVGTVSEADLAELQVHLETARDLAYEMENPEKIQCENAANWTLGGALKAVEAALLAENLPTEALTCFCNEVRSTNIEMDWMQENRFVQAPHQEAEAAVNASSPLSVIIAGKNHVPQIVQDLTQAQVPYLVMEPPGVFWGATPIFQGLQDPKGFCQD